MSRSAIQRPRSVQWAAWSIPLLVVVIWQVTSQSGWIPPYILPQPLDVFKAGIELWKTGELQQGLKASALRAIIGFAIGGSIGFILGLLNGLFRTSEILLDSTIQMLRNVPLLGLLPMVILWFGIGETSKIFIISLAVLFPIYLNTYFGIRSIEPSLLETSKVYHLGPLEVFRNILLPGALPSILLGIRYGLNFMWLVLIVAESISATSGIGYLATNARTFLQTDIIVLTIVIYALLGKLSEIIARTLESLLLPWHHTQLAKKIAQS
ncbi:MAG: ABC transporter permease subunit [Luteolibacter sp.]